MTSITKPLTFSLSVAEDCQPEPLVHGVPCGIVPFRTRAAAGPRASDRATFVQRPGRKHVRTDLSSEPNAE